jgi:sigma-E factor negative regulatory protein RseA
MKQQLSEWVDGELDKGESDRLLAAVKGDANLRASWDTYHLIGDALRGHMSTDIGAEISSRLAREPTILVPRRQARSRSERFGQWSLSVAAAAAALAMVVWVALPALRVEPQVAMAPAQLNAPETGSFGSATGAASQMDAVVANYLLAHQSYSSMGAMQGVAPYVRAVSDDAEGQK